MLTTLTAHTVARFKAKYVDEGPGRCWLWKGGKANGGYGSFFLDRHKVAAHRVAYLLAGGTIPDGLDLDHLCRNRACVNPNKEEQAPKPPTTGGGEPPPAGAIRDGRCLRGHERNVINSYVYQS